MRVERKSKVLEPNVHSDSEDSSEGEYSLATSHRREAKLLATLKELIDRDGNRSDFHNARGIDHQTQKIMLNVFIRVLTI